MLIALFGFLFITLTTYVCSYYYGRVKHKKILGIFVQTSYNSWENIKVCLTSYYVWLLLSILINGDNPNFWFSQFVACISIVLISLFMFYNYIKITKKVNNKINYYVFLVTAFISQLFTYRIQGYNALYPELNSISILGLIIIFLLYLYALSLPSKSKILKDPVIERYHIKRK